MSSKRKSDASNLSTKKAKINDPKPIDQKSNAKINDLSDDVLIKIIRLLPMAQWPSLENVSKQFQRSTFAAWRLVKEINLDDDFIFDQGGLQNDSLSVLNSIMEKLVSRTPYIKSISGFSEFIIDDRSISMDDIAFNLLARFASLERVDFGHAKFQVANFIEFLKTSKNREKLKDLTFELEADLNEQDSLRSAFGDPDLPSLELKKITFLEEEWEDESYISYGFLEAINVSKLTSLQFSAGPTNVGDFIALMIRADQLEKLDITFTNELPNQDDDGNEVGLEFPLVRAISTMSSRNLFSLKLHTNHGYNGYISNGYDQFRSELFSLIEKLGQCYRLMEFSLTGHNFYGGISAISNNLRHLRSLEVAFQGLQPDITELTNLVTKLTCLEELTLQFSDSINADVMSAIAANLKNLKNLKKLSLDRPLKEKPEIFNRLGCLEKLEELRVTEGNISFEMMLAWNEFGRHLKSLELPECSIVGDKALIDFLKKSPRLRRLNLAGAQITDTSLKAIANLCPLIEDLNLDGCKKITLSGIQTVADGCTRLKRFVFPMKFGKYRKIKFD